MRNLLTSTMLFFIQIGSVAQGINILHLSFHKGCLTDFEAVAQELDINVTSWWVHEDNNKFEGRPFAGGEVYNINPMRAERVWKKNKAFFETFDVIITSDTAPLARIFLQNGWKKPLIIWVCNRFDYAAGKGKELPFPDPDYYKLMRKAVSRSQVRIISYTPYEYIYARNKGVPFPDTTIRPVGKLPSNDPIDSFVPATIDKEKTFFIFPRLEPHNAHAALQECQKRDIIAWTGKYNGPEDIKDFKAVIFFPYAFSNIALFENIQRGVIHFVPTERFLLQLGYVWDHTLRAQLRWCEWYQKEFKDAFVFFDSWDDLKAKIISTDYATLKKSIKERGSQHRASTLSQWRTLFSEILISANNPT